MKRIVALFLILMMLFSLVGCMGTFYKPVESTPLEATTVMTFEVDGVRYEMRYELYRLFFLNYKNMILIIFIKSIISFNINSLATNHNLDFVI